SVAAPVPAPPGHLREAALAAALRSAEPLRTAALTSVGRPVPMRSAPRNAGAAPRRINSLSAAAVLVVAIAVGGWAISQIGGGSSSRDTNSAFSPDDRAKGATPTAGLGAENDAAAGADTGAGAAGTTKMAMPPYDAGEIGGFNDVSPVLQRAAADLGQSPDAVAAKSTGAASPCPSGDGRAPVWQATLTYNGEAAIAHLVPVDGAKHVMQILRRAGCAVIASQDFAPTTPR
ncbi:MAG: hypothetical protein H0U92_01110, partial [Actinobacteria bacterium]|nr:hypothetical protein [Actinomycetota bacterium]